MRIDEASIDHNVTKLMSDMIGDSFECAQPDRVSDNMRIITLGYLWGVSALAEALKEVLLCDVRSSGWAEVYKTYQFSERKAESGGRATHEGMVQGSKTDCMEANAGAVRGG